MDKHRHEQTVDLTSGSITEGVIRFSLPILAGYIFQTLYNNVDSLVVGNFVGKEALAAVNACTPVYNLLRADLSMVFSPSFDVISAIQKFQR